MKKHLAAFVGGVAIAIAFGVWAQAGYPTRIIAQKLTARLAAGNGDPAIAIENINPTMHWRETDAGTDDKYWTANVRSEQLQFGAINDANSAANLWLTVDRTNEVIDSVDILAPTLFTRAGTNTAPALKLHSGQPLFQWSDTDSPADEKLWSMYVSGGNLWLGAVNDAISLETNPLAISRTGTTIDTIAFAATSLTGNAIDFTPALTTARLTSQSFSGCTASSGTSNMWLRKAGNMVSVYFELNCTSNAASAPIPAVGVIPAGYRPTSGPIFGLPMTATGTSAASNASFGTVGISTAGTLSFTLQDGSTWDNAGSKGFWLVANYPTDY